jgi:signal transduction histidine kinase
VAHSLTQSRSARPRRWGAFLIAGVGLFALADLGLLIAGVLPWSLAAAMIAVGLLVSASMAIGYDLARTPVPRDARGSRDADLGGLAHDLRAPLTTTRSLLQLVESGSLGELTPAASDALGRAALAAGRVEDLLQRSLLEDASTDVETPRADLGTALSRALDALHTRITESGAVIERGALPVVAADPIDMERVLTNLVLNSITHARPGQPPHIRVRAERDGRHWLVSVSDDGPGVPAALRERAFEPGVRGFSSQQSPGFGLGLSTVRRLVESHGGRAWIDPTTRSGASVQIELPAA